MEKKALLRVAKVCRINPEFDDRYCHEQEQCIELAGEPQKNSLKLQLFGSHQ